MFDIYFRYLFAALFFFSSQITFAQSSENDVNAEMVIKYHFKAGEDYHHSYNIELIHRALEVTRAEYGGYKIQTYGQAPTAKRQAQLLKEGDLLNMQWAPPGTAIAKSEVIEIPIDILRGLQGYRVCMINSRANVNFSHINDVASLKSIRLAQGASWDEIPIYHYNNIRPIEPPILGGLYPMLGLNRFDCIPLGVNEVTYILEKEKQTFPFLSIESSLIIYYDFPIYIYVSKRFPNLARRLASGLNKLSASGEFDELFRRYHEKNLEALNLHKRRIICLKSPFSNNQQQCRHLTTLPQKI